MYRTPPGLRRSQRIISRRNVDSNENPRTEVHGQQSSHTMMPDAFEPCTQSANFATASLPDRQMHQRLDDATGNDRRSLRSFRNADVTSNTFNVNTPRTRAASHVSSQLPQSEINRRRLEIQLEFAKKKQEATIRALEIEEQLALAKLGENDGNYIDNEVDVHSVAEVNRGAEYVHNWLHNSRRNLDNNVAANRVKNADQVHEHHNNYVANQHTNQHQQVPDSCRSQANDVNLSQTNRNNRNQSSNHDNRRVNNHQATFSSEPIQPQINRIENWITRQTMSKDLPKFSGNPLDWPQFITQYNTSTRLCHLTNAENQMRLQKSLSGQALSVVQPLLIYPDNVDRVIDILERRFGRTEYIIRLLIERVRNFAIIKEDKLNTLIEFFDILSNMVYTLEGLQKEYHLRDPLLFEEILNKLPLRHQTDFIQYLDELNTDIDNPSIVELHSWLERKVSAASRVMMPSLLPKNIETNKQDKNANSKSKALTFAISDKSESNFLCEFCSEKGHTIHYCKKFKKLNVDDRWDYVTKNRFCFCCLKTKHSLKFCKNRKFCAIDNCKKNHHPLLHKLIDSNSQTQLNSNETTANCHIHDKNHTLLKIIPIVLKGPTSEIESFALLDEGSTVSLIDAGLARQLGLDGPKKPLTLQWTNNQINEQKDSQVVSVLIKGIQKSLKSFYTLRRIKTINDLALPYQTVDVESLSKSYSYLSEFKSLSYFNGHPMILIGQDNWPVIVSRKVSHGVWNGPTISKTLLGWVIHGNVKDQDFDDYNNYSYHVTEVDSSDPDKDDLNILQDMIKDQWNFDVRGTVNSGDDLSLSVDDKRCMQIYERTIKRVGNRYECGLLWKQDDLLLTESRNTAIHRLKCLEQKMDKNPSYAQSYTNKMSEYISKGYIQKLSDSDVDTDNSKIWYLPHFGVVNPNKPNKLRIVFDAAAKSNGMCLNDYLLTGPDFYNSLSTILMNFRCNKVAFIGDIKEMFLQILVKQEDKPAQRILWRGMDRQIEPEVYEIQVIFFGATCSPSIAQAVLVQNAQDQSNEYPHVYREVTKNHYMDDYLGCCDSEEDAIKLIHDISQVHKNGGFEICNWICNSKSVLSTIEENLKSDCVKNEFDFDSSEERVLGVWWNFSEDVFVFRFKFKNVNADILNGQRRPSKREILKVVMSVFDPLGLLSNIIIVGKILLQNIWESGISWDSMINDSQYNIWQSWCENLTKISNLKIPRLLTIFSKPQIQVDLHLFCDASQHAYAAAAYLRFESNGEVECKLINSKARVAPLKPISIPRLELMAALLASRLSHSIKSSLNMSISSLNMWCDSKIVLSWIKSSSRRYKTFVAQRIGEIHDLTDPTNWRYIPSKLNVADDATKFKDVEISSDSRWFHGPEFLKKSSSEWPIFDSEVLQFEDCKEELKNEFVNVVSEVELSNEVLPDISRFSNWWRFVRAVAWFLRATESFKQKSAVNGKQTSKELLPAEIDSAEIKIWQKIQTDCYNSDISLLKKNQSLPKSSPLYSLSCFLDSDNIIRLKGRLGNAQCIDNEGRHPIVLGHKHALTKLLVSYVHTKNNHLGTETIITDLRKRFWITKIRNTVKNCNRECHYCKIKKSKPQIPIIGQLPCCRVERTVRPFIKCGIDYFGPINILVGRRHEKRYGVLFTCMAMRAIHIEIANDASFNSFMHVFRQFGSRRGFPEQIYSDNGSIFRRAAKEFQNIINDWPQDELTQFCTLNRCKWFFNPPACPHMGGVWERLIGSVKKHLEFILIERYPQEYVLRTLFCEIEFIINNRPLTYNSDDPNDPNVLTPNDLLIGSNINVHPPTKCDDKDLTLLSMWRASQRLADNFWKRWVNEYLPSVLQSRKWPKISKNLSIGDVVIIVDNENPRNCWPKGRVVKTFLARDGYVRIVDVETASGIFRRPVAKLIKIDVLRNE